jgi:hypothetical protein
VPPRGVRAEAHERVLAHPLDARDLGGLDRGTAARVGLRRRARRHGRGADHVAGGSAADGARLAHRRREPGARRVPRDGRGVFDAAGSTR